MIYQISNNDIIDMDKLKSLSSESITKYTDRTNSKLSNIKLNRNQLSEWSGAVDLTSEREQSINNLE